jgi:epoxyqueuosine reductase
MIDEIRKITVDKNISFIGIGNLDDYSGQLSQYGYPVSKNYSRSISIGIPLINTIVDRLGEKSDISTIKLYRHFCYDLLNLKIDMVLVKIAALLHQAGYDALPIQASKTVDRLRLFGLISHKAAAYIAGLGWIGKSCLLIHEHVGPRARWGTVLTNAPLGITGRPVEDKCRNCNVCVKSCPAGAFSGKNFNMHDKREIRYDAHKCDVYLSQMEEKTGYRVCGICIKVCPYGQNKVDK